MKELSIQKAKAYDGNYKVYTELINRLEDVKNAIKKQNYGIAMDILCKPYPDYQITTSTELAESEDERIRKALCELVHDTTGDSLWVDYDVHKEDALAWLEKQGEQKDILEDAVLDTNKDGLIADTIRYKREKQSEQKPTEEYNITGIGSKNAQGKLGEMIKNLKPVNDVLEQKPVEWSEEDEKKLSRIVNLLYCFNSSMIPELNELVTWFKSLKARCLPQPKQEWSEEDIKKIDTIIGYIASSAGEKLGVLLPCIDWLKSLRPQWKPSNKQMKAIEHICDGNYNVDLDILDSIYRDFKKLREK